MKTPSHNRSKHKTLSAVQVNQWLTQWNQVEFDAKGHRRRPDPHFYIFSVSALELRRLCGISRRQTNTGVSRAEDLGIQRQHDKERSAEIGRFVDYGYPWSTLTKAKRESTEYHNLRKPGWLPTSIVINILTSTDKREGKKVDSSDLVTIGTNGSNCYINLPYADNVKTWRPQAVPPFEVIDGQHRLFSFEDDDDPNFQLPVVAFFGLDVSWQAYLFWTINIKPKKINASLAFDLYPLLRGEDWLDRAEGHPVYRETRAQELTESLWAHPKSPWYDHINMLGERNLLGVTQSAWIRSLLNSFIRSWNPRGSKQGGLFGGRMRDDDEVLGWNRAQQAAFLIFVWDKFKTAVQQSNLEWCKSLRQQPPLAKDPKKDLAFYGPHTLIATDQGVRGFLLLVNDICFRSGPQWALREWRGAEDAAAADEKAVSAALTSLAKQKVAKLLSDISSGLASFDWRSSSAPSLSNNERRDRLVFRGSSGYKELREQLLDHLARSKSESGKIAKIILENEVK